MLFLNGKIWYTYCVMRAHIFSETKKKEKKKDSCFHVAYYNPINKSSGFVIDLNNTFQRK